MTASADNETVDALQTPPPKRTKLSEDVPKTATNESSTGNNDTTPPTLPRGFIQCLSLLTATTSCASSSYSSSPVTPPIPSSLTSEGKTRNDLFKLRSIFDAHGFRTSVVRSPRLALSIYKDSCQLDETDTAAAAALSTSNASVTEGKEFILSMLGLHPKQVCIEKYYSSSFRNLYTLMLFCDRIRVASPMAVSNPAVRDVIDEYFIVCRSVLPDNEQKSSYLETVVDKAHEIASTVPSKIAHLTSLVIQADRRIRPEQLQREYERILVRNSTFANARTQLFVEAQSCDIKDVFFKRCQSMPKFERITVYLYDSEIDLLKPPRFAFLPGLGRALKDGPEVLVEDMVESFWSHLLRHGYFATERIKKELTPELRKFFLSGIADNLNVPLKLNAHFDPKYHLSLYIHGKAGAGKTSLARNFSPALNAAIEDYADPEIQVRYVKQNLNKHYRDLQLELELRPNNNDLSVMSIIQGRRMTLTQTKPGLVVVDLEEMPSNREGADPNQLKTCQLISQRFSGRNGDFKEEMKAPRNSAKRGISGDATLLSLFTSNYGLQKPCVEALSRLEMFKNIKGIEMTAVSGADRIEFAQKYITQCVHNGSTDMSSNCRIDLQMPVGEGDTRPLVRHLRMIAFFIRALVVKGGKNPTGSSFVAQILHSSVTSETTVKVDSKSISLKEGSFCNLYPIVPQVFDDRTRDVIEELREVPRLSRNLSDLSQIIDFYFANTLAPTVIVSRDESIIKAIIDSISNQKDVHSIKGVDADTYKMMKSLYDPNDTPNLRDDILNCGRGSCVAIELKCPTIDAQLCIREIIEDSPSMTAFSTSKSALYKTGLFFGVHVVEEITPEVRSRASLVIG